MVMIHAVSLLFDDRRLEDKYQSDRNRRACYALFIIVLAVAVVVFLQGLYSLLTVPFIPYHTGYTTFFTGISLAAVSALYRYAFMSESVRLMVALNIGAWFVIFIVTVWTVYWTWEVASSNSADKDLFRFLLLSTSVFPVWVSWLCFAGNMSSPLFAVFTVIYVLCNNFFYLYYGGGAMVREVILAALTGIITAISACNLELNERKSFLALHALSQTDYDFELDQQSFLDWIRDFGRSSEWRATDKLQNDSSASSESETNKKESDGLNPLFSANHSTPVNAQTNLESQDLQTRSDCVGSSNRVQIVQQGQQTPQDRVALKPSLERDPTGSRKGFNRGGAAKVAEWCIDPKTVRLGAQIGVGGSAQVHSAYLGDMLVAAKVYSAQTAAEVGSMQQQFAAEASVLAKCSHPNIIRMYGLCIVNHMQQIYLLIELCQGNLMDLIDQRSIFFKKAEAEADDSDRGIETPSTDLAREPASSGNFTSTDASDDGRRHLLQLLAIATQVIDGMMFLHQRGLAHRDLKPQNVLLQKTQLASPSAACAVADVVHQDTSNDSCGVFAKVCDFGLARSLSRVSADITGAVGTPVYMAPEIMSNNRIDPDNAKEICERADVYSFGVLLYTMYMGKAPFRGMSIFEILSFVMVQNKRPALPSSEFMPACIQTLIQQCWHQDPSTRPPWYQARSVLIEERVRLRQGLQGLSQHQQDD